jgi:hypothetical protein
MGGWVGDGDVGGLKKSVTEEEERARAMLYVRGVVAR